MNNKQISTELKEQCSARANLIADMMASGSIITPTEYLDTPILLIKHLEDEILVAFYKRLMRTRKPAIPFNLNGRNYRLTRRLSIFIVTEEMKSRNLKP